MSNSPGDRPLRTNYSQSALEQVQKGIANHDTPLLVRVENTGVAGMETPSGFVDGGHVKVAVNTITNRYTIFVLCIYLTDNGMKSNNTGMDCPVVSTGYLMSCK